MTDKPDLVEAAQNALMLMRAAEVAMTSSVYPHPSNPEKLTKARVALADALAVHRSRVPRAWGCSECGFCVFCNDADKQAMQAFHDRPWITCRAALRPLVEGEVPDGL